MTVAVFLMVLGAAAVHATWNALVKSDGNRLAVIKVMSCTQLIISICLIPFAAIPAPAGWPYLFASSFINVGYMLFLTWAYQVGDLSHVYPFARGVAPLIVVVVSVSFLGEQIDHVAWIAVLLIALGVTSLALTRGAAGLRELRPMLLAFVTGIFIAAYTIIDALGARSGGTPHGYMIWVSLLTAILIVVSVEVLERGSQAVLPRRSLRAGVATGLMSYASSWLVIWALTLAPIALVSALRETGIVFAAIIGVVFLGEKLNLARLASITTTLIGTTLLKYSR